MKLVSLATILFLLAALGACGEATPPGGKRASQAATRGPDPSEIVAALPPDAQPYGLDVYTAKCVSCHGALGQGVDANPALGELKRAAMFQRLLDYRAGKPQGERVAVMAQAVAGMSDAELAAASIYAGE